MKLTRLVICLVLLAFPPAAFSQQRSTPAAPPSLPNPVLVLVDTEHYEANGKQWTRYVFAVDNSAIYPNELFAAAPELPPCGQNAKASRTWIDIYEQSGKRLNGFCALGGRGDLGRIWFALEGDTLPPSWVYIEMNDRKANSRYKSNLAETTM